MEHLKYDKADARSIVEYAKKLKGKTLREACREKIEENIYKGKGGFGQLLEKFYFGYEPNSIAEPDFAEVDMELKSSPLKIITKSRYRSKERLVLNIINYVDEVEKDFETSSFWKKNAYLLLVFYLYEKDKETLDYIIKIVDEWKYSDEDFCVIKRDWETIKKKIAEGKAHEISEGDTFYLGACTKGAGHGGDMRKQPFNVLDAKQRAFSLKQGYVNHIIAKLTVDIQGEYGKIIKKSEELEEKSFEEIVVDKFAPFFGISVDEIALQYGLTIETKAKNYYSVVSRAIINKILDVPDYSKTEEFSKADLEVKTVRIQKNGKIKENISFPYFKFTEIVKEEWDESKLKSCLSKKFLWIFLREEECDIYVFDKVEFWNMPYLDLLEAKKAWDRTVDILNKGEIFNGYKGKQMSNNFPKSSENEVCHVRPHGKNRKDVASLPIEEVTLKRMDYTKQCFWLNNTYVLDEVYGR